MGRPYSMDLRDRVIWAVEREGLSRNEAARRFGVAISTAVNWLQRYHKTGSCKPGQIGGHVPRKLRGSHRDWLLERTKTDFTLRGLVGELAARGMKVDYRTVWSFVHDEGLSFKKKHSASGATATRRRQTARTMEEISGQD
jgi:putative transposase